MTEEKKEETVCAKKYESDMKDKDSEIEALKKEIEALNGTVAKYEEVKKSAILENLKNEGVETEQYKNDPIDTLEKLLNAVKAFKVKVASEEETNSGATVTATETKKDEEGDALSKAKAQAEAEAEAKAKEDARMKEIDEKADKYGY